MTHYFCYQCERAVPIEAGTNLQCPQCAGDFLEELAPNDPRMPSPHPFGMGLRNPGTTHSPARSPGSQSAQSIPQNAIRVSLMDMLLTARDGFNHSGEIAAPPPLAQSSYASHQSALRAHRTRIQLRLTQRDAERVQAGMNARADVEGGGDSDDQYEDVDSLESFEDAPNSNGMVRSMGDTAQLDVAGSIAEQEVDAGESGSEIENGGEYDHSEDEIEGEDEDEDEHEHEHEDEDEEDGVEEDEDEEEEDEGGYLGALHRLMGVILSQTGNGNRVLSLQNFLEAMGPSLGYYGNPGDYVTQEQYDALISRMMDEKKPDFKPASEEFIDKLEKRTYTSTDGQLDCSVCRDDFKEEEVYNVLPCTHLFHKDCITSWLKENNNCPLCRQKFDTKAD